MGEEADSKSPFQCPYTVTVRRNPHRRARPTPSTAACPSRPLSSPQIRKEIPSFPIQEIMSMDVPSIPGPEPQPKSLTSQSPATNDSITDNLKVFMRVRPLTVQKDTEKCGNGGAQLNKSRSCWPKNPSTKKKPSKAAKPKKEGSICITVNDCHSVTLCPPLALQDIKRARSEVFEGFSHVFTADSSQEEVYGNMMCPLVDDFLHGKSGMLATLGATGSGKTHTVFGSPREPGMVPQALRQIFSTPEANMRTFYLSMFEIYSEKGKGEKMFDLSQDGSDLWMQQTVVKGLQEAVISNVQEAEALIARGMLKRATAMTNSNNQSSRSQCIINIRSAIRTVDGRVDQANSAMLTIVDLAGAEREKRTGNQGVRLLESNFINNTSMVFGLCLRSLLEHQKNPKKPLQKHFQNSLLTRYLREYLEGKRRMALLITVKSGDEDYLDTSLLLRQASPYTKIKFNNVEEGINSFSTKRQFPALPKSEHCKRMKFSGNLETCTKAKDKGAGDECQPKEEGFSRALQQQVKEIKDSKSSPDLPLTVDLEQSHRAPITRNSIQMVKRERENKIMQGIAKALWHVLKEYRDKLKVADDEIFNLQENLSQEKARRFELEHELKNLKSCCLCSKEDPPVRCVTKVDESYASRSAEWDECLSTDVNKCINTECESFIKNVDDPEHPENLKERGIEDTGSIPDVTAPGADSGGLVSVISSPQSLETVADNGYSPVDADQLHGEKDEKCLDQSAVPENNFEQATEGNLNSTTNIQPSPKSCRKPLKAEKPKRRLAPASSILLKDINCLGFEDDNEKPKGNRGEKLAGDERNRTQGSISLLRLLRTNLHL